PTVRAEVHATGEVAEVARELRLIAEEPEEIVVAIHRDRGGDLTEGVGDLDVVAERSEEHTSELQSRGHLVCRLLLEKKKKGINRDRTYGGGCQTSQSKIENLKSEIRTSARSRPHFEKYRYSIMDPEDRFLHAQCRVQ